MADNSSWSAFLAWAETVNPTPFVVGLGGLVTALFVGVRGLTSDAGAARKSRAEADIALRGRLSIEAAEALTRKEADVVAARAEKAEAEAAAKDAEDIAHAYEDWARDFLRHPFNNALTELDGIYRVLARVVAQPRDDAAWIMAQTVLDNRRPWPTPVVPSPAEIRNRKP